MDKKKIANFLHELIRKRNAEQLQSQEFNNWDEAEEAYWQDRTDEIYKAVEELENDECNSCECKQLTIDEAISHANERADRDNTQCAKNHKQLADWLSELKGIKSRYAYLAADFDNYKKRVAKAEAYAHDKAFQDVILHFLSIYDDMERLYKEVQDRASYDSDDNVEVDVGPVDSGFEMIFENFEKTLDSLNCKKIDVNYGDKFDVNFMEAIAAREIEQDEGYDSNDVVDIVQSGWKYKDVVLRPAKVVVAK